MRTLVGFVQIHHDQMEVSRFALSHSATPALFRSAILEPLTRKDQFVGHLSRSHSLLCVVDDLHCPAEEEQGRPSALLELLRQLMTHSQYNEPGKSDATVVSSLNFVACGDWTVATTVSARLHRQLVCFTLGEPTYASARSVSDPNQSSHTPYVDSRLQPTAGMDSGIPCSNTSMAS
jgi:hypothetical protein